MRKKFINETPVSSEDNSESNAKTNRSTSASTAAKTPAVVTHTRQVMEKDDERFPQQKTLVERDVLSLKEKMKTYYVNYKSIDHL